MHVETLIHFRPTSYHQYSPLQLILDHQYDISHLHTFGRAIFVPIAHLQCIKIGFLCRLGIYIGFNSLSIIKYLELLAGD